MSMKWLPCLSWLHQHSAFCCLSWFTSSQRVVASIECVGRVCPGFGHTEIPTVRTRRSWLDPDERKQTVAEARCRFHPGWPSSTPASRHGVELLTRQHVDGARVEGRLKPPVTGALSEMRYGLRETARPDTLASARAEVARMCRPGPHERSRPHTQRGLRGGDPPSDGRRQCSPRPPANHVRQRHRRRCRQH
jgi:hypothetical protein